MATGEKITTAMVQAAMRKKWAAPEYAIIWEVAPRTGGGTRYADAMIMPLWASHGHDLHGVEIKVSRSDWMRESKDPTKAEALAKYCDFWWIHTVPGVIHDISEVPPAWGVRVFDGRVWRTMREAKRTPAAPVDRHFLASMMRRATEGAEVTARAMAAEALAEERASIQRRIDEGIAQKAGRKTKAEQIAQGLIDGFGIDLNEGWHHDIGEEAAEIGALIRTIRESGVLSGYRSLAGMAQTMRVQAEQVDKVADEIIKSVNTHGAAYVEAIEGVQAKRKKRRAR